MRTNTDLQHPTKEEMKVIEKIAGDLELELNQLEIKAIQLEEANNESRHLR